MWVSRVRLRFVLTKLNGTYVGCRFECSAVDDAAQGGARNDACIAHIAHAIGVKLMKTSKPSETWLFRPARLAFGCVQVSCVRLRFVLTKLIVPTLDRFECREQDAV